MWNASRFCVSSLRRGHANLLCIVPILVYVPPKRVHFMMGITGICTAEASTFHDGNHRVYIPRRPASSRQRFAPIPMFHFLVVG
ncbi:Monogalactosyldiacylglycerol synthase 2, chloroplastic [Frankliniella fusca]|uniref:Monogalactosyldiacylglycerol synthase 2, chloroplastic n=1 Tax=Frankliniella fusca TaxID=407009 RepID=A0AAE1HQC6_9NEOP|nr:Monogalactosyldiacylglycerol synthase 2, chloroplastic [Frankliniella fusca]